MKIQRKQFALAMLISCIAVIPLHSTAGTLIPSAGANDVDGDGLPDSWERDRSDWGLRVGAADFILVPVFRPDATTEAQQSAIENLEKVKSFFASLDVETEQGISGIQLHARPANGLDRSFNSDADPVIGYREVRSAAMPEELMGYAHGYLMGTGAGGGQTSGTDWSAGGINHETIIHELGHQLGLGHEPRTSPVPSLIYTSLMNYDYQFSFNGDPNAIHFSEGKFAGLSLDERSLNEQLPFEAEELEFLSKAPYQFEVQDAGGGNANVDFNRNKVFGEMGVSADVNDGSGVSIGRYWNQFRPNSVSGDLTVASLGEKAVVFYTDMPDAEQETYEGRGASADLPGHLKYKVVSDRQVLYSGSITSTVPTVTGAPDALTVGNRIILAYPAAGNLVVFGSYRILPNNRLSGNVAFIQSNGFSQVSLTELRSPSRTMALMWNPDSKEVEYMDINISRSRISLGERRKLQVGTDSSASAPVFLRSEFPPTATINTKTDRLHMLVGEERNRAANNIKMWTLGRFGSGEWRGLQSKWITNSAFTRTVDRPTIIFDDRPSAGGYGRFLIYYRRSPETDGGPAQMFLVRVLPPHRTGRLADSPFVFRERRIINIWTESQNAPAVARYRDDFVFAQRIWRPGKPEDHNRLEIFYNASGEYSQGMTDFNDLGYIATTGLKAIQSLRN